MRVPRRVRQSLSRHWRLPISSACPSRIALRFATTSALDGLAGGSVGGLNHEPVGSNPLQYLDDLFSEYIAERRLTPRDDVLTGLATATYPDGSIPPLLEVVRPATFLFGAGQETVTKLLSSAVQVLGDRPELQDRLRADRKLIGPFIEEALRMQSPTKVDFRLTRKSTTLGGVPIKAGTVIMLCLGAANRDPRKFERSQRVSPRSQECSRAHRFRARHSHMRRGAAGQSRGPGDHQQAAGPNTRTSQSARQNTDRLVRGNTATRRPSCCAAERAPHRIHASDPGNRGLWARH